MVKMAAGGQKRINPTIFLILKQGKQFCRGKTQTTSYRRRYITIPHRERVPCGFMCQLIAMFA